MQHDTALSSLDVGRLNLAIARALLLSIPLWGVIAGAAWLFWTVT